MFEIGNTLREARLRRGLDVAECEVATKIRAKYLRALEEEQFEVLPGVTYVKGFLRTYAEYLDLDGRLVLDEYESRFLLTPARIAADGEQSRRRARRRRNREGRVLAVAASAVMIASTGLWVGFADDPPAQVAEVTTIFKAAEGRATFIEVRRDGPQGDAFFTPAAIEPGQVREVTARPPIWVTIGDGSGFAVSVDGREMAAPQIKTTFFIRPGGIVEPVTTP